MNIDGIEFIDGLEQGSDEWLQARCGIITASTVKNILTPTLKIANNEKTSAFLYEMAAQRITGFVEPSFQSDAMVRGHMDEVTARDLYAQHYAPVAEIGFIRNTKHGVKIGYSPDGLVGDDGLIEVKSRAQKHQVKTVVESDALTCPPQEYMFQLQTGLLVSERKWIDFISYSGGMDLIVMRVLPDPYMQSKIIEACQEADRRIGEIITAYHENAALCANKIKAPTQDYSGVMFL